MKINLHVIAGEFFPVLAWTWHQESGMVIEILLWQGYSICTCTVKTTACVNCVISYSLHLSMWIPEFFFHLDPLLHLGLFNYAWNIILPFGFCFSNCIPIKFFSFHPSTIICMYVVSIVTSKSSVCKNRFFSRTLMVWPFSKMSFLPMA